MPRLFVALNLPGDVGEEISRLCCGLAGARWADPMQLHLTLGFIGDTDGLLARHITDELRTVTAPSFSMRLQGMGHFPPGGKPRILWVGVEKNKNLKLLHKKIGSTLRRVGLRGPQRKFIPHITLARLRNCSPAKLAAFLAANSMFRSREFMVEDFHLYSSILSPKGARHLIESSYPLA